MEEGEVRPTMKLDQFIELRLGSMVLEDLGISLIFFPCSFHRFHFFFPNGSWPSPFSSPSGWLSLTGTFSQPHWYPSWADFHIDFRCITLRAAGSHQTPSGGLGSLVSLGLVGQHKLCPYFCKNCQKCWCPHSTQMPACGLAVSPDHNATGWAGNGINHWDPSALLLSLATTWESHLFIILQFRASETCSESFGSRIKVSTGLCLWIIQGRICVLALSSF